LDLLGVPQVLTGRRLVRYAKTIIPGSYQVSGW
jgi:hypothetical protein